MSNYGLSGASGAGDAESNANFESLLAQLRRQSSPSPDPNSGPGPDQFAQFGFNQGAGQSFYNHLSNSNSPNLSGSHGPIDSPAFLPEAPTPPVGFSNAQFPPGLMNPIGAGRNLGGVGGDDRTANLLNLLKYSSSGGQGGGHHHQQQQQQQQQQPHHQQQQNLHHQHQSQPQQTQQLPATREPPMNFAPAPIAPPVIHAPAPAAADPTGLLAALMKGRLEADSTKPEQQSSSSTWNQSSPPSSGTQQYLLNLLNKPKPSQHDADLVEPSLLTPPPAEDESSHGGRSAEPTLVGTLASRSEFEFEHKNLDTPHSHHSQQSQVTSQPGGHGSYSNPFDDVSGSSPAHRTPKSSTPGASSAAGGNSQPLAHGVIQILKKPDSGQSNRDQKRPLSDRGSVNSPESARRKLEHAPSPLSHTSAAARPPPGIYSPASDTSATPSHTAARKSDVPIADAKESVSEAVTGLAEQADREAREALARAQREQAQAEIPQDLDKMLGARTEEEFAQSAQGASQAIMKELDKDKNKNVLQSTLTPELAKEVTDILEEASQAAQGPVADSWESAEADEIVVIEETAAPVKVYNFPMKPWITISLQETNEARPVFRDEAILDIARLKKDFDQIDRNLVSASETYMAYGMSKAGGLRVIRQEDGKDAKLFTDTKDRIFNVAISTSPSSEHPKEAIIGTGVSGTVYWVQLKSGDRDHLEDAHPEQYGFALPPVAAPEGGDTPGGVLKTRARASSMHPDYFAVGRGKSINIIWPSFILENNLFKNAHDRVVDTEKLLKQCSLKINTGKAGKDFTFSQDDTLVVSLDKSGRVKFWDVRDLTAVKEGSDPLNPMPAQTSLEIKEPLMTLTTTPEGEKAWPTSVLLLDKFRPYQRRTALRYMIVGMKQNHTLQLWDLALGKPVQEFNFPHNKESDAVCSVMYHAPSSMIVVGHPTRNSIYFLHLSAPKYSLKNLSQVDYIQRLVAQDQSIPQPESTAVISGIREYSFANKGVLRSLNMLENPAASGDGDEPTLFELYAMHSKGVTCLFVKQAELGWTKDNKVISPADAVDSGLAKVSKLVAPPPAQPVEPQQQPNGSNDAAAIPQIRIASRGAKDILQKTPSSQGEDKREAASPPKLDRKDENETPVPQPERAEKKGRKKKNAAAAAAAAGSTDRDFLASNGSAEISRAPPQNKAGKTARSNADSSAANSADLSLTPNGFSTEQLELVVNKMEARIVASVSGRFDTVFNQIFQQMQDVQKKRDADFAFSQSHLLQLVSDVLNDNTESVLKNLIIEQIENSVVPSVSRSVERTVVEHLGAQGNAQINGVQKEIQRLLPNVVAQALQKADMVKTISDRVSHNVNAQLEIQINKAFSALAPGLAKTTAQTVHQRIVEDVNGQINNAFERLEERRRDEDAKLDRLIAQTKDLSNAISSLAASQTQIIKDLAILREQAQEPSRGKAPVPQVPVHLGSLGRNSSDSYSQPPPDYTSQQQFSHQHQPPAAHSHAHQHTSQRQHQHQLQHQHQTQFNSPEHQVVFTPTSHEDREKIELDALLKAVDQLMQGGHFDDAMMRWLQSNKTEEVFQQVISRYETRNWLPELAPLLLLSVGATIANDFHPNTPKLLNKIDILELLVVVFQQKVPSLDDQTRDVTPRIMGLLKARSEELLVAISRIDPHHSALKQLSAVSQGARHIMESVPARHGSGHHNAPY